MAPSFVGYFDAEPAALLGRIRDLGFDAVEETASAIPLAEAAAVPDEDGYRDECTPASISSACPRVVALVLDEFPHLAGRLSARPSALAAHCSDIRRRYGPDSLVVFFGPCPYKAWERKWSAAAPDLVVTFDELEKMLQHPPTSGQPGGRTAAAAGRPARSAGRWERAAVAVPGISGLQAVRSALKNGSAWSLAGSYWPAAAAVWRDPTGPPNRPSPKGAPAFSAGRPQRAGPPPRLSSSAWARRVVIMVMTSPVVGTRP